MWRNQIYTSLKSTTYECSRIRYVSIWFGYLPWLIRDCFVWFFSLWPQDLHLYRTANQDRHWLGVLLNQIPLGRNNGSMWRQQQQQQQRRRRRRRRRSCGFRPEAHPSSYLAPYTLYPTSHTTTAVPILGTKTCNLPFYCAALCAETHCRPGQASFVWEASRYSKTCSFSICFGISSCVSYLLPVIRASSIQHSIYYCTWHRAQSISCSIFGTIAVTTTVVFMLCPICTPFMRLFLDGTHARGA